jgi:hypothetical protein
VSSINKTNRHDTAGILLKVALNTTPKKKRKEKETNQPTIRTEHIFLLLNYQK